MLVVGGIGGYFVCVGVTDFLNTNIEKAELYILIHVYLFV